MDIIEVDDAPMRKNDSDYQKFQDDYSEYEFVPLWVVQIYFCVIGVSVIINISLLVGLLRQEKRSGTVCILIQQVLVDLTMPWIAVIDVWSLFKKNWEFGTEICQLFTGSHVVLSTATIYLHGLLNLHTVSLWKLERDVNHKNPLTSYVDESKECLVELDNPSSNRSSSNIRSSSIGIDANQRRKQTVSVILPSVLIWFCCLSLSIPEYIGGLSINTDAQLNRTLCTVADIHYGYLLTYLLVSFKIIIPALILLVTLVILIVIVCSRRFLTQVKKNCPASKYKTLKQFLNLALFMNIIYITSTFHRHVLELINGRFMLDMRYNHSYIITCLTVFQNFALFVRPVLSFVTVPSFLEPIKIRLRHSDRNS